MSVIYIEQPQTLSLVKDAINKEVHTLEIAIQRAKKRLQPYEQKYAITSSHFINHYTAEDLEGGDDEYIQWAGEYKLLEKLQEKHQQLQNIRYDD